MKKIPELLKSTALSFVNLVELDAELILYKATIDKAFSGPTDEVLKLGFINKKTYEKYGIILPIKDEE